MEQATIAGQGADEARDPVIGDTKLQVDWTEALGSPEEASFWFTNNQPGLID